MDGPRERRGHQARSRGERFIDLQSTDLDLLRSLGADEALAFSGLRRKMHVHHETLSRALHRPERDELVVRTEGGYALAPQGAELSRRFLPSKRQELRAVLRSYLPAGADPELLTRSLLGRWFGNLRWLGRRDAQDETQLLWMTFDPEVESSCA